jgi:acetyltransferase-like isoleucine patch superfamily enzyme
VEKMSSNRFKKWTYPEFDSKNMTKWNWMCENYKKLDLGEYVDIGAFTYINAKYGVKIEKYVQIGSHCSIYTQSTIDNKKGKVIIKEYACIGTHSTIMPGVIIGKNALIGAHSFINIDIPDNVIAFGVPVKIKD